MPHVSFAIANKMFITIGAVAGLSMVLWKSPSTAIYAAVKATEVSLIDQLNARLTDRSTNQLVDCIIHVGCLLEDGRSWLAPSYAPCCNTNILSSNIHHISSGELLDIVILNTVCAYL